MGNIIILLALIFCKKSIINILIINSVIWGVQMDEELLQMAQLVSMTRHYLQTKELIDCIDYGKIKSIEFQGTKKIFGVIKHKVIISDMKKWMKSLSSKHTNRIYLLKKPETTDVTLSDFTNAPEWYMVSVAKGKTTVWFRLRSFDYNLKKWNVRFLEHLDLTGTFSKLTFEDNISQFKDCLKEIGNFAGQIECDYWAKRFQLALGILEGNDIEPAIDIDFRLLSEDSQKILRAVTWAWIFGGNDSWVDSPFIYAKEKNKLEEYKALTSLLYDTIMESIMFAVNL